ncbi:hypothetical protein BX265_0120 [Streptomyces sp. TLI_235]|nr:hypothetical protein [Streptomyces sp. TLI_235]PBC75463.1 hypothetical protein BX265_0120 [Streptomyces sp. TLI_235]
MTSSTVTVFRGVRPFGAGAPVELIAVDGLLADRVPADVPVEVVDGGGRIALPTLVDAHIHPDKTAWGEPWYSHRPTDALPEYVRGDVDLYEHQRTPLAERAHRLLASRWWPSRSTGCGGRRVPGRCSPRPRRAA